MSRTIFLQCFAIAFVLIASCSQSPNSSGNGNSKMVYGSPPATITHETPPAQITEGPLAYAPNIPAVDKADTVNVRIDVLQTGFHVTKDVSFDAWMFGDSIPGPVLKVRVGQTVHFVMTNRADKSTGISMIMPHSIDFHP
ncbi:MAG TPA: hypothetical protein VE978_03215, partial [Chitinophagales bacterium]|nr:hypothetical protein [Chitinophagales bacterium]